MAVTPVAYYSTSYSSLSGQTHNFSSLLKVSDNSAYTIQPDDMVVALCFHSGTAARTLAQVTAQDPTAVSYTAINASVITSSDTNFASLAASYKFMGATPDASVTTPPSASTTTSMLVVILVFSGVDQTTPLAGVTPVTATGANGARPDCGSITTPASPSGCVIVGFGGQASALGTALTNPTTTPFDATARYTGIVSRTTATNNGSLGYGIKTGVGTSTAFDPSVWNGGQSTNTGSNGSLIFVLAPTVTSNTFNDTISDGLTAAQTLGAVATMGPAISDALTAAQTNAAAATMIATVAQSLTASDSAIGGSIFADNISAGALTVGDALVAAAVFAASTGQALTAADSVTGGMVFGASFSASLTASDAASSGMAFNAAFTEGLVAAVSIGLFATDTHPGSSVLTRSSAPDPLVLSPDGSPAGLTVTITTHPPATPLD